MSRAICPHPQLTMAASEQRESWFATSSDEAATVQSRAISLCHQNHVTFYSQLKPIPVTSYFQEALFNKTRDFFQARKEK